MKRFITASIILLLETSQATAQGREMISEGVGVGRNLGLMKVPSGSYSTAQTVTHYDTVLMANPTHPLNGATGDCFGPERGILPYASGTGNCVFVDAAGDLSASRFDALGMSKDGALFGTWTITGGTGKFAGSTGGGRFHSLTDPVTGQFENRIEGAMVLR